LPASLGFSLIINEMATSNPAKLQKSDSSAESVFVYTGAGCSVPRDVVRVQFDPSVVEVANNTFYNCKNLLDQHRIPFWNNTYLGRGSLVV